MKRCSVVVLTAAACCGFVAAASAQNPPQVPCLIGSLLPMYTQVNMGPTAYDAAVMYPEVANAVLGARAAWNDHTHAVNRIGNGTTIRTASDCPVGQPLQIGAFDFMNTNCAPANGRPLAVAYTDSIAFCAGCGTKSISLNTHYMFSTNPQSGQYDIGCPDSRIRASARAVAHVPGHLR